MNNSLDDTPLYRVRPFVLFWFARVLSALGLQMTMVAIGWLIYEKTGSAYYLGLVGLCQFVPVLLLTFVVGHVADRMNRRRIIAICQMTEALVLSCLAVGAATDRLDVPTIFVAVFVLGAARAFEAPTLSSILPGILPPGLIHRAISVSSSAMQVATILGPSIGGLLYAFGIVFPLGLAALMFFMAGLCILAIRVTAAIIPKEPFSVASVLSGVRFIGSQPLILGTISLDLFAVLLGGITSLLPIFAKDVLQTGPWGLGVLRSAPAIGALVMSLLLTRSLLRRAVGMKMFVAVIIFGTATVVFSLSDNFLISFAALVALGSADNISVVIRNSLVLLSTPDAMRGRVNAVNSLFIGTSNQVGDFESGIVAGLVGAVPAGLIGGVGTILIALLWMRLFPQLRDLDVLPGEPEQRRSS